MYIHIEKESRMARVTVEDCIQVVPNRYELVLIAAQRARDIASGAPISVERDNDKNPVIALREIAEQTVSLDDVRKHIVDGTNRMGDLNDEDGSLLALANAGIEGEPLNATAAAIEETVFDGVVAAMEETGDMAEMGSDDLDGATDMGVEDFSGAEETL